MSQYTINQNGLTDSHPSLAHPQTLQNFTLEFTRQ